MVIRFVYSGFLFQLQFRSMSNLFSGCWQCFYGALFEQKLADTDVTDFSWQFHFRSFCNSDVQLVFSQIAIWHVLHWWSEVILVLHQNLASARVNLGYPPNPPWLGLGRPRWDNYIGQTFADVRISGGQQLQTCLVQFTGSSGRARAILIIAEGCSTDCITRPPRDVADREQPHEPPATTPLRTLFPPDASFTDGYLTIEQDLAITNEMQNMPVDLANMF